MRLPLPKRITSESVQPEMQPAIDNIAGILNPFMEDVVTAINGNLDFENLIIKTIRMEVIVDTKGNLRTPPELNTGVLRPINGMLCINVEDGNNSNSIPDVTSTPAILFNTLGNGIVRVNKILNLKENKKYILTLMII